MQYNANSTQRRLQDSPTVLLTFSPFPLCSIVTCCSPVLWPLTSLPSLPRGISVSKVWDGELDEIWWSPAVWLQCWWFSYRDHETKWKAIYHFKGIVHPKKSDLHTLPRAIQDVEEFVSSWDQIWRNIALHYLLTNGSSAVNGCRQNESKQLIKNITITFASNPRDCSASVNVLWSERLYVWKKQINHLTPNWCFRLKYKFSIYKIAYYSEKKSESGEKHAEIKHCWQAKTVLNKYINGFRWERTANN